MRMNMPKTNHNLIFRGGVSLNALLVSVLPVFKKLKPSRNVNLAQSCCEEISKQHKPKFNKNPLTNLFPYCLNPLFPLKKPAFTLAEVLITLGIIGVVAAMTIPNLIQKNFERRVVSHLRETQSILSQAIRMAEEEYGDVSGWGLTGKQDAAEAALIAEYLKPFIKLAADCGTSDEKAICTPNTKYKYLSGSGSTTNYNSASKYYKVRLMNGSSVWWRGGNNSEIAMGEYIDFWIDVNGSSLPNTLGKDLFLFIYESS